MPGVGPPPLMPAAVLAVSSLNAVSFTLSLDPSQLVNDTVELVHAGLSRAAYGLPDENYITVLRLQSRSSTRAAPEFTHFSSTG